MLIIRFFFQPTEQDMASEAFSLEGIARKRLASDRQFRAMAPPMDWEAIASDGADKIAAQWNESAGLRCLNARP